MEGDMAKKMSREEILDLLRSIEWGKGGCPSCGRSGAHASGCSVKIAIWKLEYDLMPGRGSSVRIPEAVRTGARPAFA